MLGQASGMVCGISVSQPDLTPAHPDSCVPPRRLQSDKSFHCNCWMVTQLSSLLGGGGGGLPDLPGRTIVIQDHPTL